MTLASVQYWIGVKLTLNLIASPSTTKDVWFTTRPNTLISSAAADYWPIILAVEGLGYSGGDWLPEIVGGTISLDNRPGTFGLNRKFSDVLERYAIVNQPVVVYVDTSTGTTFSFDADDVQWSGRVESWSCNFGDDGATVDLQVSSNMIDERAACYVVEESTTNFPDADENCIGKVLPLVAGPVEWGIAAGVPIAGVPYRETSNRFLVEGAMSFQSPVTSTLLGVNDDGYLQYYDGTWVFTYTSNAIIQSGTRAGDISLDTMAEVACKINDPGTFPLGKLQVSFHPNGTGTDDMEDYAVTARIYEVDSATNTVGDCIAECSVLMSAYNTQNNAASDFYVDFDFKPIVVFADGQTYALGISCVNYSAICCDLNYTSQVTTTRWYKTIDPTGTLNTFDFTLSVLTSSFMMLQYNHCWWPYRAASKVNKDHFDMIHTTLGMGDIHTPLVDATEETERVDFDVVCEARGLYDNTSGTISGTPSGTLSRTDWFLKGITCDWNGTYWAPSTRWDFTTYATQYAALYDATKTRGRALKGFVPDYVTLPDLVEAVCKDSATKIGITNAGLLFPWPWGYAYSVTTHIPPADIVPQDWSVDDPTSVVNRASLTYNRALTNMTIGRNQKSYNYNGRLEWSSESPALAANLAADSVALYGTRPLEEIDTNFVSDAVSAASLLEYYMSVYAHPTTTAEFTVPWAAYKTLKMYDVITFAHPDFPTFYGATSEDAQPVQVGASAARANLSEGRQLYRAKQYRGIIEGRFLQLPVDGAPSIRLRVRVLLNYPKDPT